MKTTLDIDDELLIKAKAASAQALSQSVGLAQPVARLSR